jgi:hypothetical protein
MAQLKTSFNAHANSEILSGQGFTEFQQKEVCGNEQFTVRIQINISPETKKK